jgi:hypothetical protein
MTNTQLHIALQLVAGACDGAVARDGVGFSGSDASHGSWLAASHPQTWGPDEVSTATWLVNKYRGQIVSQDVTLPEFLGRDQGAWDRQLAQIRRARKEAARTEAARLRAAAQRLESERRAARTPEVAARDDHGAVDLVNGRLRVTGPLKGRICWERVDACQAIPGREYDREAKTEWYSLASAQQLFTVAREFGLWVACTDAQLAAAPPPAPVPEVTRLDADTLMANPGYDRKQAMKDALGNFRPRWDPESRRWLIPVPPSALPEILRRLDGVGLRIDSQLWEEE